MKGLRPLFTDFTWAAGGSTSELTLKLTSAAKNEMGTVAYMHLTCTNIKAELVCEALADCKKDGMRCLLARGASQKVLKVPTSKAPTTSR